MRNIFTHNFKKLVLLFIFVAVHQIISPVVFGQSGGVADGETFATNPKIRDNTVTASVADIVDPSVPILIDPEDEELINDATPAFIWQESTDNVGVSYYEIYLDGELLHGSLPTSNTTTSEYTLTYNSGSGRYTLIPEDPISDGGHTWQIFVYDAAGNSNSSVIWDFTIDTLAPSFVIESIGPEITSISSSDIDSVPDDPIELEDNEPEFIGTAESNSSIQVTVQIPGESNQIINFNSNGSGEWDFQLGILPRDEIITLNFVITDSAGNISIVTDLKILIIQDFIIIPPTPTTEITPTPIATTSATPTPVFTPIPTPLPTPIIKIPILPPKEIVEIIKKEVVKAIPKKITQTVLFIPQGIRQSIKNTADSIAPVGVLIATAAIPVFSFLTLLLQFGQQFSFDILLKILQALGFIPPQEPQGIVFDSQTNEPVAFSLLTITSTNDSISERIIETVVTDVDGIYQGIQLPLGKYIINVNHQDYNFPTTKDRPSYLNIQEYYKGEEFEVTSTKRLQLFMIPVDKKTETQQKSSLKKTIRGIIKKIKFTNLFWPLFALSIIITLFYPTWLNFLMLSFYFFSLIRRFIKSFKKPTISGFIRTQSGEPVQNATIRISDPTKGELVAIISSNKNGYYEAFLDPKKYQIQITKTNLIWERKGSQLSLEEVDVTQETKVVDAVMRNIGDIYKELFGNAV
jgi:hypothetical protein